jgi:high affinity sulfate transporter 1
VPTVDLRPARWLPGLRVVRTYRREWLARDVYAGLALGAVLVPAGMGYAVAAGLPAVAGLYATVVPLLVYALVGPSRIMVFGPDSSLAPLIAATVVPLAGADVDRLTSLAAALALFAGAISIAAGCARFGFLTDLLSIPVRYGYLNGIALLIFVSQIAKMCEIPVTGDGVIGGIRSLVRGVRDGELNTTSLALGAGAVAVTLILRRWVPRVPAPLVVVVAGIAVVKVLDLSTVSLVGRLPAGLPSFELPAIHTEDLGPLLAGAAGIAVVSMTDTSVLSRTWAMRERYDVEPNHELVAAGTVNAATALFQGFPVSSSASRTPVAAAAGAKTQLTGVVGALATLVVLAWLPGLFADLPSAVLAAIVVGAAISLVEIRGVRRLARLRPAEFVISLVAFAGVAVVGVIPGIGIAVAVSLLAFIRKAWAPHTAELVRVDGLKGYHDVVRHPSGRRVPGLALLRFDAPLFFANAEAFKRAVLDLANAPGRGVRWIVVTAEPVTDIDVTGVHVLGDLLDALDEQGVVLAFAELKGRVRDQLAQTGLVDRIGSEHFYPTVGQAVRAAVTATGVAWTDWEDSQDPARPSDVASDTHRATWPRRRSRATGGPSS